jgi:putative thioredoxin
MPIDVEDFQRDVLDRSTLTPVLVDFWADWCGPCRILGPVLEKLAAEANGTWELKKVDTEKFTDIALQYRIKSIPCVMLFVDGKPVQQIIGALPEADIHRWISKGLPDPDRKTLEEAENRWRAGALEEASKMVQPVVERSPHNERAKVLLAKLRLFSDRGEALRLVDGIDGVSKESERAESVRTIARALALVQDPVSLPEGASRAHYLSTLQALSTQEFETALEGFISLLREDRYFDDDGSRKACVAIFKYLGEDHPTTVRYRREFARSLY